MKYVARYQFNLRLPEKNVKYYTVHAIVSSPAVELPEAPKTLPPRRKRKTSDVPVPPLKGSQALKETSGRRRATAASSDAVGGGGTTAATATAGISRGGGGSASVERIKTSRNLLASQNCNEEISGFLTGKGGHRNNVGENLEEGFVTARSSMVLNDISCPSSMQDFCATTTTVAPPSAPSTSSASSFSVQIKTSNDKEPGNIISTTTTNDEAEEASSVIKLSEQETATKTNETTTAIHDKLEEDQAIFRPPKKEKKISTVNKTQYSHFCHPNDKYDIFFRFFFNQICQFDLYFCIKISLNQGRNDILCI